MCVDSTQSRLGASWHLPGLAGCWACHPELSYLTASPRTHRGVIPPHLPSSPWPRCQLLLPRPYRSLTTLPFPILFSTPHLE